MNRVKKEHLNTQFTEILWAYIERNIAQYFAYVYIFHKVYIYVYIYIYAFIYTLYSNCNLDLGDVPWDV